MKISKRQLRRIIKEEKAKVLAEQKVRRTVRRRLMEIMPGPTVPGAADRARASAAGGKLVAELESGAYVINDEFVTNGEDHMLDQLQDILDMGVTHVDDAEGGRGTLPIAQWEKIIVDQVDHPENRRFFEDETPTTRWRG
jgi:hypothetical protein